MSNAAGAEDRVVIRSPVWRWNAVTVAAMVLMAAFPVSPWMRPVWLAAAAVNAAVYVVPAITLTPGELRTRTVRGRRSLPWGDVESIVSPARGLAAAVLRDGTRVRLPNVLSPRPDVPPAHVDPRSPQAVVAYARAHGHAVDLTRA